MAQQRRMLEDLGVDGMSSEEEVQVPGEGKRYVVLVPTWRAAIITPWLRVFDSLYLRYRTLAQHGDQRGCMPRRRCASRKESTSDRFVPGLPINAYRADWLTLQLDVANTVHPSAEQLYNHDDQLVQYVLVLTLFYL
jgi:hypothetical protein